MRKNKSENGITLLTVSLVVVVLIIIGGIAVNIKLNSSGLMENAEEAVNTENAKHSHVNSMFDSELEYYPEAY